MKKQNTFSLLPCLILCVVLLCGGCFASIQNDTSESASWHDVSKQKGKSEDFEQTGLLGEQQRGRCFCFYSFMLTVQLFECQRAPCMFWAPFKCLASHHHSPAPHGLVALCFLQLQYSMCTVDVSLQPLRAATTAFE